MTAPPVTTHSSMLPVQFEAPPVNPAPNGLFGATIWTEVGPGQPSRFLLAGVEVRGINYGGEGAFGVWGAPLCGRILIITVSQDATDGTFDVTVDGQTATIAYDANAGTFQTALLALSNLDTGDVSVASPDAGTYTLTFAKRRTVSVDGTDLVDGTVAIRDDIKAGTRPGILDAFAPVTVWAYDECDLTAPSRAEVEKRAAQILRLQEQVAVERELANRLLTDAGTPENADDITGAISHLEAAFAKANTTGFIHLGAQWAAAAAASQLLTKSGTKLLTPLGNTLIFGGGYVDGLEDTLVATSQPFGWRDEPQLRTAIDQYRNTFAAIAERTVVIGYEAAVGAATITS